MKKLNRLMFGFLFIAILFISVSYAAFNTNLFVSGNGILRAQADVRVIGIKNTGYYGEAIENYNPNYNVDLTNMSVDLPTSDSKVTYEVTIKNYSNQVYLPEIEFISGNNPNVVVTITDGTTTYTLPDDDMNYGLATNEEKKYTITISNKPGTTNNDVVIGLEYHFVYDEVTAPAIAVNTNAERVEIVTPGTSTFAVDHYEYYTTCSSISNAVAPTASSTATGTVTTAGQLPYSKIACGTASIWYRTVSTKGTKSEWSNGVEVILSHTLTYHSTCGTCSPNTKTAMHGQPWGTLCNPNKEGYTFNGWFTDEGTYKNEITASSIASSDVDVYSKCTINNYTLTFNSDGGSSCSSITKPYQSIWGTLCTPTKAGYTFEGWFNGTTEVTSEDTATANITVKAKWTANELIFNDKTITKTYSGSTQTDSINVATNGTGSYTYEITGGNGNDYFSITNSTLNISAKTPAGTYTITVKATDSNSGSTKSVTYTIKINPKEITSSIESCANKEYDGTNAANCTVNLSGVETGDTVTVSGSCTYNNASVENNKTVSCSTLTLDGADASNYTLTNTSTSKEKAGSITQKKVTATINSCSNKEYDGTTAASCTFTVSGKVGSETVTASGTCTFNNKNVGTSKAVTCTGITLSGTNVGNYTLGTDTTATGSANITAKELTPSITSCNNKQYNGNANTTCTLEVSGLVGSETVTTTGTCTFNNASVGNNKTASCTGITIGGDAASNYTLGSTTASKTNAGNITKKDVTLSIDTCNNKPYDGTTTATCTFTVNGKVGTETVTGSGTCTFENANVGTGKTVTCSSLTLGGTNAGNYNLTTTSLTGSANITGKSLTPSIGNCTNRQYNGNATVTCAINLATVESGDTVTASGTCTAASAAVGSNKTVTCTGITLNGADKGNYTLSTTEVSKTSAVNITAKSVTATVKSCNNKVYDGTTSASCTLEVNGKVGTETVTASGTCTFDNKNVGTGKTVTCTGITLAGANAGNYTLGSNTSASGTANITAKTLTPSVSASDKTYDKTTTATCSVTLEGIIGSETVTATATGAFENANIGTGKTVTCSSITLGGTDKGNYTLSKTSDTTTADITAKSLTPSIGSCTNKQYNGNATVTCTISLTGVASGDTVTASGTCTAASASVGNNKTVTCTGITLGGTNAGNYTLSTTEVSKTSAVNITKKDVTAAINSCSNKEYNGNTTASCTFTVSGKVGSETVTASGTCTFNNKNVGTGKTVTCSSLTLGGTNAGNYNLTTTSLTGSANITAKTLPVSLSCSDKVYNGNTTASCTASVTPLTGDTVTVSTSSCAFDNKNVGTEKAVTCTISKDGTDKGNYSIATSANTTAKITAKTLTPSVSASDKTYDKTTAATCSVTLEGIIGSETVTATATGAFENANIGTGKTVTCSSITLGGTDKGNYTLSKTSDTTTADITAKSLTPSIGSCTNKQYNGNATVTCTISLTGVASGDTVTASGTCTAASASVGNNKTVTCTGITLGGTNAGNYTLSTTEVSKTSAVNITKKDVTASISSCSNKEYNGNTTASCTLTVSGKVGSETVTASGTCTFNNKNVGTGKTVTCSSLTLGGANAGNYNLTTTSLTGSANITAKTLSVTLNCSNKDYNGNTTASCTGSVTPLTGDTVTVSTSSCAFDNKNVGTGKTVTCTISKDGTDKGNYSIATSANTTAKITAKTLTPSVSASDKTYDKTTAATCSVTLEGIIGSETVTATATGAFENANIGTGKTVTCSSITLGGTDKGNYTLSKTSDTTTADITAKSLTPSIGSCTNKQYNGNATVTCTISLTGVASGDTVTASGTCSAASASVGNNKTVTCTGITLGGANAGNYTLSTAEASKTSAVNITKKDVTASINSCSNKEYNGNTTASCTFTVSGKVGSETVTASGTCTFNNKNVGTGKTVTCSSLTLGGANAGNYNLTTTSLTGSANITAKTLPVSLSCSDKVYNGNTTASCTGSVTPLTGDTVTVSTSSCAFANKNVGTGKTVTCTISKDGTDKGNYSIATTATGTAKITAKTLPVTLNCSNKEYNASDAATCTASVTPLTGDTVTVSTSSCKFNNKNVGTGKAVTCTISKDGTDKDNYTIATSATGSANITAKTLSVTLNCSNKDYNGNTTASCTGSVTPLTGDTVTVSTSSCAFENATAGTGKTVTCTISKSGTDKDNYSIATSATGTANINKIANTLTVTAKTLTYNTQAQSLVTTANAQGTVYYSLENDLTTGTCSSSRGSTTIPTGTNAGSYTVYYCTTGNSNYNAKSGSVNVTIGQFDISSGTIGSVSAQNYSGSAIKPTPEVSVTINGSSKTLTTTTEYTYSYTSNTNPTASAKVTATGTGNYKGTLTQTFTIKPRVTFAANGGSGTMSAQHVNYNSATALTENSFTRTGYTFAGWNTKADGSGTSYADKANITTTSNVTLNAQWTANNYTLTFNANGGSVSTTTKNVTYGTTYTDLPTPTRSGYAFNGWYATFNGSSDYVKYGREYMFTDKISIHISAYMENWSNYSRAISCTEGGGWNLEPNGGKVSFANYDSGTGYKAATSSIAFSSLSSGWHDFDMIFDGSNSYLYIDGAKVGTSLAYSSGKIGYNANNMIIVGAEASGNSTSPAGSYFNGYIGNIIISNNSTLISSSTYNTITAPAQNLVLYARWSACGAGTYSNGNTCSACPAGTYSNGTANASCTNCTAGYYCEAGSTTPTQHECAAGKYCPAGTSDTTIKTCPTADSGWTATSPAKSTAVTACYETQTPTNCSSGTVKRVAKSDGSGYSTTITLVTALKAKANYYTTTTATSCTACPTNYGTSAANTNSGASACYLTTASGKFVSTANAAPVDCTAGGYCPGSVKVNYGSTGGRTQCSAGTYNNLTGQSASSACKNCTAGYYCEAGSTSATQHECAAGKYCPAGTSNTTIKTCPTADSGWTATSPAKSTAYSACYEYQTPTNCSSGSVKRAASSATAYSTTITLNETLKAKANYYTTTTATSCTACPTNYGTSAANTNSGASACYLTTASGKFVSTANAAPVDCTAGGYCPGSVKVNYGSTGGRTACPTADSGWAATSPAKSTAVTACYETQTPTNCSSGTVKRVAKSDGSGYSTTITLVTALKAKANYYTTPTATSCTACSTLDSGSYTTSAANTNNGTSACYLTTETGEFVSTANAAPVDCTAGGYCPGSVQVSYGSTGGRTACGAGKYNDQTGSSESSACKDITAGCYGTSATTACPAKCAKSTASVAGSYSAARASQCTTCGDGQYTSAAQATSCAACPKGKYCSGGKVANCPADTYRTTTGGTSSASCTACPTGYSTNGGTGKTAKSACTITCDENERVASADATCSACATGYHSSGGTVAAGSTSTCSGNEYTVSFDRNCLSTGSGGQANDVTATYGSAMPSITTTAPVCAGYTFQGWYDSSTANGGTQYYTAAGASAKSYDKLSDTTLYGRWGDSSAPEASITNTNTNKSASQTLTLQCTDNLAVTGYYYGTTAPTASSTYSTTAADLTALQGSGLTKTVSSAGTYYLSCKDASGNTNVSANTVASVQMVSYTVKNMLLKVTGTKGTYSTTNYDQISSNAYVIKKSTSVTPDKIYTTPTGSNSSNFKGYSTAASPSTLSSSSITISSTGTTYYMWFDRIEYTITADIVNSSNISKITLSNQNGSSVDATSTNKSITKRYGENVIATATAVNGFTFNAWSGLSTSTTNPLTISSNSNGSLSASATDQTPPTCTLKATSTAVTFDSYSDPNDGTISGWKITTTNTQPTSWDSSASSSSIAAGTYYGWVKDAAGNISGCTNNGTINITSAAGMYTCTKAAVKEYTCSISATPVYTCEKPGTVASSNNVTCNTAAKYNSPSSQCSSGYTYAGNSCSVSYSCPNGGTPTSSGICQLGATTKYRCFQSASLSGYGGSCDCTVPSPIQYSTSAACKNSCSGHCEGKYCIPHRTAYCGSHSNCSDACVSIGGAAYLGGGTCTAQYSCPGGTQPSGGNCLDYTDRDNCNGWTGSWSTNNTCSAGSYNSSSGKCEYDATPSYSGTISCNTYSCSTGTVNGTVCNTTGNVGSCDTTNGWSANPTTPTGYDCATNYPGSTKVDNKCYKYSQTSCSTGWTSTETGKYLCPDGGTCDDGNSSTCTLANQTSTLSGWTCTNTGAYCTTGAKVGDYCYNNVYAVTLDQQSGSGTTPTTIYYQKDVNKYYSDVTLTTEITKITNPTRTGYTFGGYYTGTNGSGTQYITGASTGGVPTNNLYAQVPSTFQNDKQSKLFAKWIPNSYTLTINQGTGTTVTVNRISTNSGGSTGNLSNGATIYYDDVLRISYTVSSTYDMGTHTVNSTVWTSGNNHTVTGNVTVTTTATIKTYTVTYNCNGGSKSGPGTATVTHGSNATLTGNLTCGPKIVAGSGSGTSASPAIYYQTGWSESSGGSAVSSLTITSNKTIYAVWSRLFTYNASYTVVNEGSGNWSTQFKSSGSLAFATTTNIDIHVTGGGGGGAGAANGWGVAGAGGGGGGASKYVTGGYNASGTISITIGSGGAYGNEHANGSSGGTSSFGSLVTAGGGGGGGAGTYTPYDGAIYGNGGSGGSSTGGSLSGSTASGASGGRGGAPYASGVSGGNGNYAFGTSSSGSTRYGAGGGGGCGQSGSATGSGGTTGGGRGGACGEYTAPGAAGSANTGSGGGGCSGGGASDHGGVGGSGIVIIRNHR